MTILPTGKLEITVDDARKLEQALNDGVERLQAAARKEGKDGILVTRHLPGRFVLELSTEVPFGYTHERG